MNHGVFEAPLARRDFTGSHLPAERRALLEREGDAVCGACSFRRTALAEIDSLEREGDAVCGAWVR